MQSVVYRIAVCRLRRTGGAVSSVLILLTLIPSAFTDETKDSAQTEAVEKSDGAPADESEISLNLKVVNNLAVLAAEREFTKGVSESASFKRKAKSAGKPLTTVQRNIQALEVGMRQAQSQLVGLNTQLANVSDVASNNRLVGAINTIEGKLQLAQQELDTLKEGETKVRAELNAARETYVEHVLALRRQADRIKSAYESEGENEVVTTQLQKLIAETGKQLTFGASATFASSIRKLDELEKSIRTEKIPLRADSNTYFASVVINGEHTAEMVVDSGASLISIPYKMAVEFGLEPKPNDKQILLTIADGSTISGHLKTIDSVRVGTFVVKNVECAVLGPEAISAQPLLGMTFLGEFQFELDAAGASLGLTEIDGETTDSTSRK